MRRITFDGGYLTRRFPERGMARSRRRFTKSSRVLAAIDLDQGTIGLPGSAPRLLTSY
jgi:hypothetical protein